MNAEEKAKAYDEAIERAREMCAMPTDKATMEYVFPELKESEDERIRARLIQLLDKVYANTNFITCEERERMIAYLEKLKDFDKQLEDAYKNSDEVQYKRGFEDALASLNKANEEAIREIGNEMKLPIIGQRKTDGGIIGKMQEQINELGHKEVTKKSEQKWTDEDEEKFQQMILKKLWRDKEC